jgi:hypothetical protein
MRGSDWVPTVRREIGSLDTDVRWWLAWQRAGYWEIRPTYLPLADSSTAIVGDRYQGELIVVDSDIARPDFCFVRDADDEVDLILPRSWLPVARLNEELLPRSGLKPVRLHDGDYVSAPPFEFWLIDRDATADIGDMSPSTLSTSGGDAPLTPEWTKQIGPMLRRRDISAPGSAGGVATVISTRNMLSIDDGSGTRLFPAFQFDPETRAPFPELANVVPLFRAAGIDDYTAASWFRSPQVLLGGETPATWLAERREERILVEAARRTIARLGR